MKYAKPKTGVILAAGETEKLNLFATPKPLISLYGEPLIARLIRHMRDAGLGRILVVAGEAEHVLREVVEKEKTGNVSIEVIRIHADNNQNIIHSFAALHDLCPEGCVVASGDLVFESNPFGELSMEKDIEMLLDERHKDNAYCGSNLCVESTLFGRVKRIGLPHEDLNAWHTGVYWMSNRALKSFKYHTENNKGASLVEILQKINGEIGITARHTASRAWFDINTPETLMRAELALRRGAKSSRPTQVPVDSLVPLETPLSFFYEKKAETKIMLEAGLLKQLRDIELMHPDRTASHHILITDECVDKIFGDAVLKTLEKGGYSITKLVCPIGEKAKTIPVYNDFAERITGLGIDEHSIIFALGGGVVANLSGFLAATLYRGIGLIHIPTSFMNMVDVSISLKQGINNHKGKNMVGSYYQPLLVLIDPSISIPDDLVRDGISESIKHSLCQDRDFYDYLLWYSGKLDDIDFRKYVIQKTIELKVRLMHSDVFEHHEAMILQYGHEIGHGLEFLSHFRLTHGQAISIGMRVSAELAHLMGVTAQETIDAHKEIFKKYGLPYVIPGYISREALVDSIRYNKKTRGKDMRFVLPERVGKVWKIKGEFGIPCPVDLIAKAIEKSYEK